MNTVAYRLPQIGDEYQISGCMWASAVLWELTDGTPESISEWLQICHPEELREATICHCCLSEENFLGKALVENCSPDVAMI